MCGLTTAQLEEQAVRSVTALQAGLAGSRLAGDSSDRRERQGAPCSGWCEFCRESGFILVVKDNILVYIGLNLEFVLRDE